MIIAQQSPKNPIYSVFFTLAMLGFPLMTAIAMGETAPTFELTVPPLVPEQPYLKSIRMWNNDIVVESEDYNESTERWISDYHVVDLKSHAIHRLLITGCKTVRSIAENARSAFALCRNDQRLVLLSTAKGATSGWNQQPLPVDFSVKDDQVLVASEKHLAILSGNSLYWRTSGGRGWQRSLMPEPSDVEVKEKGPPQHALLTDEALLLGFNYGEFGGGLVSIPVRTHSAIPLGPSNELSSMNVIGIVRDDAGTVWVAGGLAHLGGRQADLVMIRDGVVKTLLNQGSFTKKGSSSGALRLPGSSDVSGLCLDPTEKPLLLATRLGIFEVGNSSLTDRIKGSFHISYEMPGYSVGSSPVGMVCTADGSIVVATRSTGILGFVKNANGYDFRQLVFGYSVHD